MTRGVPEKSAINQPKVRLSIDLQQNLRESNKLLSLERYAQEVLSWGNYTMRQFGKSISEFKGCTYIISGKRVTEQVFERKIRRQPSLLFYLDSLEQCVGDLLRIDLNNFHTKFDKRYGVDMFNVKELSEMKKRVSRGLAGLLDRKIMVSKALVRLQSNYPTLVKEIKAFTSELYDLVAQRHKFDRTKWKSFPIYNRCLYKAYVILRSYGVPPGYLTE